MQEEAEFNLNHEAEQEARKEPARERKYGPGQLGSSSHEAENKLFQRTTGSAAAPEQARHCHRAEDWMASRWSEHRAGERPEHSLKAPVQVQGGPGRGERGRLMGTLGKSKRARALPPKRLSFLFPPHVSPREHISMITVFRDF